MKIMKLLALLFTFLINVVCYSQGREIKQITIVSIGFNVESAVQIDCEGFDVVLKSQKKSKIIGAKCDIATIQKLLSKHETSLYNKSFDVIGKVTIKYKSGTVQYCFDRFGWFYIDGKYYQNRKLLAFLSDKLYSNHPDYLNGRAK